MKLQNKFFIICVVLLLLYFIKNSNFNFKIFDTSNVKTKNYPKAFKHVEWEGEVTLILRYNHDNPSRVIKTVNSFLLKYIFLPIIIVSDTIIPREIFQGILNTTTVLNIPIKLDLLNLVIDRNVVNYVKTKYVLIVPAGVTSLLPDEISELINVYKEYSTEIIAIPVEKKKFMCLSLELNLLQWSIQYTRNPTFMFCNHIEGEHGIFTSTNILSRIGEPFLLPFPEAFYIQTTSEKMITLLRQNIILRNKYKEENNTELLFFTQAQRQLMNRQLKIKKVIREDNNIEWYGCNRNTPRCFSNVVNSVPEYINQGRWTPPCCLRVLRETAHHVFKVLKKYNVTFWLEGGSLLGAVRIKDIIPWDYDVDIGVYLNEITKCPWLKMIVDQKTTKKQLPSVIDNEGYVWEKASPGEGDFYRVQASTHNRLHVDIFPFFSKNGVMTKNTWFPNHPQDMEFSESYLKPLTTIEFGGYDAPAPNNVKEFLELKFGKNCVENPQYPNPRLYPFPKNIKLLLVSDFSYEYRSADSLQ